MRRDSEKSASRSQQTARETPRDMRAFQIRGCSSAVIGAVLITECLLMGVRGDGADSDEKPDFKYALIGAGIGLFLAVGFIIFKVCIIRKHMLDNSRDGSMRRPKQPHLLVSSRASQSENAVVAESTDIAMTKVKQSEPQEDVYPAKMTSE